MKYSKSVLCNVQPTPVQHCSRAALSLRAAATLRAGDIPRAWHGSKVKMIDLGRHEIDDQGAITIASGLPRCAFPKSMTKAPPQAPQRCPGVNPRNR